MSRNRLIDTLTDMLAILGDRRIAIARDLTKPHELFRRERVSQSLQHFGAHRPRGEFTLIVEGRRWPVASRRLNTAPAGAAADTLIAEDELPSEADVAARLRALRDQGKSGSAAARQVARELGLNKSLVYQIWIGLDDLREPKIADRG